MKRVESINTRCMFGSKLVSQHSLHSHAQKSFFLLLLESLRTLEKIHGGH